MEYLIAFLPIVLLVGVWLYFMRGVGARTNRSVDALERANAAHDRTAAALERIADALEKRG